MLCRGFAQATGNIYGANVKVRPNSALSEKSSQLKWMVLTIDHELVRDERAGFKERLAHHSELAAFGDLGSKHVSS